MKRGFVAERMNNIGTEAAFEVLAQARELEARGFRVVHLEIGDPDFDTPEYIKRACENSLRQGHTHYTPSTGTMELRQAIAQRVKVDYGVDVDPRTQVVVMPGAKPCIYTAIVAAVNPGEEVIVPDPGFPIYESVVRFVGAKPVAVQLKEENDFRLLPEDVAENITERTKMIVVNSPNNPCGSMLSKSDVEGIASLARDRGILVLSDEIYCKIVYEQQHYSFLNEPKMLDYAVMIDGFSKTYAMTGWRLGYAVGNSEVIEKMVQLQINITSCPASFVQDAAVAALKGSQEPSKAMVEEYRKRRDVIVQGLNKISGVSCKLPLGTFYAFPNVKSFGWKSRALMEYLLEKGSVVTLHGDSFGRYGEGYLRLSYATSVDMIREGLGRMEKALGSLPSHP